MRSERDVTREMRFGGGPAWRWREAQSIVASDCIDAPIGCPILSKIVAYVARLHQHGGQPPRQLRRFAALRAAHTLEQDAKLMESARMLVLARVPLSRIARRLNVEPKCAAGLSGEVLLVVNADEERSMEFGSEFLAIDYGLQADVALLGEGAAIQAHFA